MSPQTGNLIHIGTSGWSYKHWAGIFYPPDVKPAKFLEYYVSQFGCVELNSSFYHLPQTKTVSGWITRTPPDFLFCPKLSRHITHQQRLAKCEDSVKKFFDLFEAMKPRLGPVLIQLPPGLRFDKPLVTDFLDILNHEYREFRFAIEPRHQSWMTDEFTDLLADHNISFVMADAGKRYPHYEAMTADIIYLRFHGREKLYASDYDGRMLRPYAVKIETWLEEGKEVWVFFNNDYGGFAVENAKKLEGMIKARI